MPPTTRSYQKSVSKNQKTHKIVPSKTIIEYSGKQPFQDQITINTAIRHPLQHKLYAPYSNIIKIQHFQDQHGSHSTKTTFAGPNAFRTS